MRNRKSQTLEDRIGMPLSEWLLGQAKNHKVIVIVAGIVINPLSLVILASIV